MDAWERLRWLFDTDDGGLYDIRLAGLNESGVVAAFEFIRARSALTPDAHFWHTGLQRDERVADHPDAARLVVRRVAEAFHVLAPGLAFAGVVLPDLGVFVWPDEVTLDYRMGPEWGPHSWPPCSSCCGSSGPLRVAAWTWAVTAGRL